MKNILTTIALLAISTVALAQTNLVTNGDFQSATAGNWYTNFGDLTPEIRTEGENSYFFADVETALPNAFEINLSQVLEIVDGTNYTLSFVASSAGNGRTIVAGIGLAEDPWNSDTETITLTSTPQTFSLELEAAGWGIPNSRVIFDMGADSGIVILDDVSLVVSDGGGNGGGTGSAPTTAAPTPPARDAAAVVSIFSDAYTDVAVTTFATEWSEGTTATMDTVAGDPVIKFNFVNFSGIQLEGFHDLSGMTHMYFDYWVADDLTAGEVLSPKLSNHANEDGETGAIVATQPVTTAKEWVSFDVALADFVNATESGPMDIDKVHQIVLGVAGLLDVVFIDNLYFYDANSVSNEITEVPNGFTLEQNYPNPFNPSTNIAYSLPATGQVTLEVFNLQGQKVATLVDGVKSAGAHTAAFDASSLASGVYVYRLVAGNNIQIKKMMLIK